MKLFENYNNAKQKYGKALVDKLTSLGLQPKHLQSACRFLQSEKNIDIKEITLDFREWSKYVARYENIDVNTLSYAQFLAMIRRGKLLHSVPNVVYHDDISSIGEIKTLKDARSIPTEEPICIKSRMKYGEFVKLHHQFYIIYLPNENRPYTYVIAQILKGK